MTEVCIRCGESFSAEKIAEMYCMKCRSTLPVSSAPEAIVAPSLVEDYDFVYDPDGRMVFTAGYLTRRGYCCETGCRNCPY